MAAIESFDNESAGVAIVSVMIESWLTVVAIGSADSVSSLSGSTAIKLSSMDGAGVADLLSELSMPVMAESLSDDSTVARGKVASLLSGLENAPTDRAQSSTIIIMYG